ncbi:MAG: hypothetical protein ABSF99_13940, partial [Anaerolineales bacterium]
MVRKTKQESPASINGGVHAGKDSISGDQETYTAQRDFIMGNQTNITQMIQLPGFVPPPDLEALRRDYLAHLR